jgi:predicted nucleic acid-binding Zn ribbon protein
VEELATDRRREKRLFWKGILAAVVVVVVAVVRQRYLM